MAIDTRQKRRSAIGVSLPFRSTTPPVPDGSFSQADRQQMLFIYTGILLGVINPPTPGVGELMAWRNSDNGKTYLVYNDIDEGVRTAEMV